VLYLDLGGASGPGQAESPSLQAIWQAVRQAFASPKVQATTFGLQQALVALLRGGLQPRCALEDALAAYQHWHPAQVGRR
jgi:hypothetical protein